MPLEIIRQRRKLSNAFVCFDVALTECLKDDNFTIVEGEAL